MSVRGTHLVQGLVQGFPDGTFRPEQPVTRGQLATVLERQRAHRGPVCTLSPECGTRTPTGETCVPPAP